MAPLNPRTREKAEDGSWYVEEWTEGWTSQVIAAGLSASEAMAMCELANRPQCTCTVVDATWPITLQADPLCPVFGHGVKEA